MTPAALPLFIVPLTFLFVLLIILIAKAPKAGAWIVGGLLLLAPVFLLHFVRAGALAHMEVNLLFVVPVTFLFVLLVILLAKAPRAGAALIGAIVAVGLAAFFVAVPVSRRSTAYVPETQELPAIQSRQQADRGAGRAVIPREVEAVYEGWDLPREVPAPRYPSVPASRQPLSPIWAEGIEQEFEADVYPSDLAAARALGRQMAESIRKVAGDGNATIKVVLFQEGNDRSLMTGFARELENEVPGVVYSIEADLRNIDSGEVGLTMRIDERRTVVSTESTHGAHVLHDSRAIARGSGLVQLDLAVSGPVESGRIVAMAFSGDKRASAEARFVQKPWVENFGAFASERPEQHFIVARSNGTCMSEGEAHQQAVNDARARLAEALGRHVKERFPRLPEPGITTTDVLEGGFVADRFTQSFDGSAGRIWRQAMLIDVSATKLARLASQKAREAHATRMCWARMGFSIIGVLVLIAVIYFFLNMATMGYYEWSLRIAGVVLALVAIVSILMIVQ